MARNAPYRILRKLGDGGMAEIFLAVQRGAESFEKQVVLKRIRPELATDETFVRMLLDEAHIASTLNHANIVQVLDLGQSGGRYFLAMEYVDGWDLQAIHERSEAAEFPIPLPLALHVVGMVCRALHFAHTRRSGGKRLGIVHRDISPQNVLVSREGDTKLTDFGVAKAIGRREETLAGTIKGKISYMSPEQARGEELDARSDLFSVGTLLYVLTVGSKPFVGPSSADTLLMVQRCDFVRPSERVPGFSKAVEDLILRAMQPAPEDRWQSAEEMHDCIDEILAELPGRSGPGGMKRYLRELHERYGRLAREAGVAATSSPGTQELRTEDLELDVVLSMPGVAHEPTAPHPMPEEPTLQQELPPESEAVWEPTPLPEGMWASDLPPEPVPQPVDPAPPPVIAPPAVAPAAVPVLAPTPEPARQPPPAHEPPPERRPEPPPHRRRRSGGPVWIGLVLLLVVVGVAAAAVLRPDLSDRVLGLIAGDNDEEAETGAMASGDPAIDDDSGDDDGAGGAALSADGATARERDAGASGGSPGGRHDPPKADDDDDDGHGDDGDGEDDDDATGGGRKIVVATPPVAGGDVVLVKIKSKPRGASVRFEGRVLGTTPMSARFNAGKAYALTLEKEGFLPTPAPFFGLHKPTQTVKVDLRLPGAPEDSDSIEEPDSAAPPGDSDETPGDMTGDSDE